MAAAGQRGEREGGSDGGRAGKYRPGGEMRIALPPWRGRERCEMTLSDSTALQRERKGLKKEVGSY